MSLNFESLNTRLNVCHTTDRKTQEDRESERVRARERREEELFS